MKITRRSILRNSALAALPLPRLHAAPTRPVLAHASPEQQSWQDLEFGMFVHFAPNTYQDAESDTLKTPLADINPEHLDTDQWARTAVDMGARYIVFVAKHQGGFCMWQTHTTDYGIRNTPWKNGKGDVLADVVASCKKFGLKLGLYVCPRDDYHGAATGGICKTPELQAKYDTLFRTQLTEVWSLYGPLVEVWFDGSTPTPVGDLLKKYQPHAMVFQGPQATIRWVGTESGFAPYPCWNGIAGLAARSGSSTSLDSDPNAGTWLPSEVDVSIRRPDWFWSTKNANKVLTLPDLLSIYYRSVGRGAQLLVNLPPRRDGQIDDPEAAVTRAFGEELRRRFGRPIATAASTTLKLPTPTLIDTILLQENIALGERVRAFRLEGLDGTTWKPLGEGTAIGHKRIQPIEPQTLSAVRLVVTESAAPPSIRTLAVYNTETAPPADWNLTPTIRAPRFIGKWTANAFSLDLTKPIDVAGQYLLRFDPQQGIVVAFHDLVLQMNGTPTPAFLKPGRHPNELLLNITGLDKSTTIQGRIEGAATGSIFMERR